MPDSALLSEIFRGYNDWLAEFCAGEPKRLKGIAMINVDDVPEGVRELQRCARMGLAGGMITVYPPEGKGYDNPMYEPLWAAAQDLDIPLGMHIATGRAQGRILGSRTAIASATPSWPTPTTGCGCLLVT
jgi:predicted TIM-barrel fold metal-dependent hydrolase